MVMSRKSPHVRLLSQLDRLTGLLRAKMMSYHQSIISMLLSGNLALLLQPHKKLKMSNPLLMAIYLNLQLLRPGQPLKMMALHKLGDGGQEAEGVAENAEGNAEGEATVAKTGVDIEVGNEAGNEEETMGPSEVVEVEIMDIVVAVNGEAVKEEVEEEVDGDGDEEDPLLNKK